MTALEYSLRHVPLVVTLGYRAELFQVSANGADRPEFVSGILVGAGLRLAR